MNGTSWWRLAVIAAVWSVLAAHFLVLWAYGTPANPLRDYLSPVIDVYSDLVFANHWNFFAPNPSRADTFVFARRRIAVGKSSDWVNVTNALSEAPINNSFSPQEPIFEALAHASGRCSRSGATESCGGSRSVFLLIERTSQAVLNEVYGRSDRAQIQIKFVTVAFPDFEHRFDDGHLANVSVSRWRKVGPVASL
jgi:hypothetical protein